MSEFRIIDDLPGWTGPDSPTEDWEARRPFIYFSDGTIIIGLPGEHHVDTRARHDRGVEYGEEGYVMKGLVDHPDEVRLFNAQFPLRHEIEEAVSKAVGVPVGGDVWSFAKVAAVQVNAWPGQEAFQGERTPVLADLDNNALHIGPKGGFHSDIFHQLRADKSERPFVHGYFMQNGSYVWNDFPEPPPEYGAALHQHVLNTVGRAEPFDVNEMWGFKKADIENNPDIAPQHMHNWQPGGWGKGMLLRNGEVHTWKTGTETPGTDMTWDEDDGWPTHGAYHSMLMDSRGHAPKPGLMKFLPNDYRMEQMFRIYPDGLTTASPHNREHINAVAPELTVPDRGWNFRQAQQPISQPAAQPTPDVQPSVFEVQHASEGHGDPGRPYIYDEQSKRLYLGQNHGRHWELIDATPELHREIGPHLHSLPPSAKNLEFGRVYDNDDHLEVRHFEGEDKQQSPDVVRLLGGHLNKPAIATQGIAPWAQPHPTQSPYNWNWAPYQAPPQAPQPQASEPVSPVHQADTQNQQRALNEPVVPKGGDPWEPGEAGKAIWDNRTNRLHLWSDDPKKNDLHHFTVMEGVPGFDRKTWEIPEGVTHYNVNPEGYLRGWRGEPAPDAINQAFPGLFKGETKLLRPGNEPPRWDFRTFSSIPPKIIEHSFPNTNLAGDFDGYEGRRPIVFANNTVHVGPEGVTHSDLARHVINKGYYEIDHGARQGWLGHNPESYGSDKVVEPGTANELGWYGEPPEENTNRAIYEYFSAKPHTQGWFFAKKEDKRAKPQKCKECKKPAIKSLVWAEGMAYVPVCADHEQSMRAHLKAEDGEGAFQEVAIKQAGLFPKRQPDWDFASYGDSWTPLLRMQDGTILRGEPGGFHHQLINRDNVNQLYTAERGHELPNGEQVWYRGTLNDRIAAEGWKPDQRFVCPQCSQHSLDSYEGFDGFKNVQYWKCHECGYFDDHKPLNPYDVNDVQFEHPDPGMDNKPGTTTFPEHWANWEGTTDPFDALIGMAHPWAPGEYGKALVNPTTGEHVHWGVGHEYDGVPTHSGVRKKLGVPDRYSDRIGEGERTVEPHPWDRDNAHSMVIAPDGRVTVLDASNNKSNIYESEKILADAIGGIQTGKLWYFTPHETPEPNSEPMDISHESARWDHTYGPGDWDFAKDKVYRKGLTLTDGTNHEWNIKPSFPIDAKGNVINQHHFEGWPSHMQYMDTHNIWPNDVAEYYQVGPRGKQVVRIGVRESGIYGEDWGEGTELDRPQQIVDGYPNEYKAITMRDGTRHEWPVTGVEGTPHHDEFVTQEGINPRDIKQYHWTHHGQWVNGPEQPEWDFKQGSSKDARRDNDEQRTVGADQRGSGNDGEPSLRYGPESNGLRSGEKARDPGALDPNSQGPEYQSFVQLGNGHDRHNAEDIEWGTLGANVDGDDVDRQIRISPRDQEAQEDRQAAVQLEDGRTLDWGDETKSWILVTGDKNARDLGWRSEEESEGGSQQGRAGAQNPDGEGALRGQAPTTDSRVLGVRGVPTATRVAIDQGSYWGFDPRKHHDAEAGLPYDYSVGGWGKGYETEGGNKHEWHIDKAWAPHHPDDDNMTRAYVIDPKGDEHTTWDANELPESWSFTSSADEFPPYEHGGQYDYHHYQQGSPGKAFITPDNRLVSWNVGGYGESPEQFFKGAEPHHREVAEHIGLESFPENSEELKREDEQEAKENGWEYEPQQSWHTPISIDSHGQYDTLHWNDNWRKEPDHQVFAQGGLKPVEQWNFSKVAHELGWTPGTYGKGILTNDGSLRTWTTEQGGAPHHEDMDRGDAQQYLLIDPDGEVGSNAQYDVPEIPQQVFEADPRLKPAPEGHKFSASLYEKGIVMHDGTEHRWPTQPGGFGEADGHPTHSQYMDSNRINPQDVKYYRTYINGKTYMSDTPEGRGREDWDFRLLEEAAEADAEMQGDNHVSKTRGHDARRMGSEEESGEGQTIPQLGGTDASGHSAGRSDGRVGQTHGLNSNITSQVTSLSLHPNSAQESHNDLCPSPASGEALTREDQTRAPLIMELASYLSSLTATLSPRNDQAAHTPPLSYYSTGEGLRCDGCDALATHSSSTSSGVWHWCDEHAISQSRPIWKEFLGHESIREPTDIPAQVLSTSYDNRGPKLDHMAGLPSEDELGAHRWDRECYEVAAGVENKWPHLKVDAGFYVHPKHGPGDHAWNIAPDGTIVDTTSTQHGYGGWQDEQEEGYQFPKSTEYPEIVPPGHPHYDRYVSWERHPEQAQIVAHQRGYHGGAVEPGEYPECPLCNRGPMDTFSSAGPLNSPEGAQIVPVNTGRGTHNPGAQPAVYDSQTQKLYLGDEGISHATLVQATGLGYSPYSPNARPDTMTHGELRDGSFYWYNADSGGEWDFHTSSSLVRLIKLKNGQILSGYTDTHNQLAERHGVYPEQIDDYGWVNSDKSHSWLKDNPFNVDRGPKGTHIGAGPLGTDFRTSTWWQPADMSKVRPWELGSHGKGYIGPNGIELWNAEDAHHMNMAQSLGHDESLARVNSFTVDPEGGIGGSFWSSSPPIDEILKHRPDLHVAEGWHFSSDLPWWETEAGDASGETKCPACGGAAHYQYRPGGFNDESYVCEDCGYATHGEGDEIYNHPQYDLGRVPGHIFGPRHVGSYQVHVPDPNEDYEDRSGNRFLQDRRPIYVNGENIYVGRPGWHHTGIFDTFGIPQDYGSTLGYLGPNSARYPDVHKDTIGWYTAPEDQRGVEEAIRQELGIHVEPEKEGWDFTSSANGAWKWVSHPTLGAAAEWTEPRGMSMTDSKFFKTHREIAQRNLGITDAHDTSYGCGIMLPDGEASGYRGEVPLEYLKTIHPNAHLREVDPDAERAYNYNGWNFAKVGAFSDDDKANHINQANALGHDMNSINEFGNGSAESQCHNCKFRIGWVNDKVMGRPLTEPCVGQVQPRGEGYEAPLRIDPDMWGLPQSDWTNGMLHNHPGTWPKWGAGNSPWAEGDPIEPWEPGKAGKGLFLDNKPYMWAINDQWEGPHHADVAHHLDPSDMFPIDGYFHILPNGEVESEGSGKHLEEFINHDTRLRPSLGWKFSALTPLPPCPKCGTQMDYWMDQSARYEDGYAHCPRCQKNTRLYFDEPSRYMLYREKVIPDRLEENGANWGDIMPPRQGAYINHEHNWKPLMPGKGVITKDGELHTWTTNLTDGRPWHSDYTWPRQLRPRTFFDIDGQGGVNLHGPALPADHELLNEHGLNVYDDVPRFGKLSFEGPQLIDRRHLPVHPERDQGAGMWPVVSYDDGRVAIGPEGGAHWDLLNAVEGRTIGSDEWEQRDQRRHGWVQERGYAPGPVNHSLQWYDEPHSTYDAAGPLRKIWPDLIHKQNPDWQF